MREATLKTRGVQAREELATAKQQVEECRKNLEYAREQVTWLHVRRFKLPALRISVAGFISTVLFQKEVKETYIPSLVAEIPLRVCVSVRTEHVMPATK